MATFEAQVEALTSITIDGTSAPLQIELTQFLTDGAKEIINSLPISLLPLCAAQATFTSTAPGSEAEILNTGKILNVFRNDGDIDQPCRQISAEDKGRVSDESDMSYAKISDPVYYIENNKINVLPNGGSCKYSEVQYPTVAYGDSAIGSISLSGVTATAADPTVFTKSSHGLSTGDIVKLSNFNEMTEVNGMTGTVTKLDANTFEVNGVAADPAETTGGNVVKLGGFPDEAEYLVPLYASVKALQSAMSSRASDTAVTTALTAMTNAIEAAENRIDKMEGADESVFGDEDTFLTANSQVTRVKDALDKVSSLIEANKPASGYDAHDLLQAEDVELLQGNLSIVGAELQRAQMHLSEWIAIGDMRVKEVNASLSEAQGYASEIQARLSVITTEYNWMEKQQIKLESDYEKGLQRLRG